MPLIIAILVIILLLWVAGLVLGVALAAVPGFLAGMVVGLTAYVVGGLLEAAYLGSDRGLERAVNLQFASGAITWQLKSVGKISRAVGIFLGALGAAGVSLGVVADLQRSKQDFLGLEMAYFAWPALPVSVGATVYVLLKIRSEKIVTWLLLRKLRPLLGKPNDIVAGLGELENVECQVSGMCAELGIAPPVEYRAKFLSRVEGEKGVLLRDPKQLHLAAVAALDEAKGDSHQLSSALTKFRELMEQFEVTALAVGASGSMSLRVEADKLGAILHPANLPSLLESRKWAEFHEMSRELLAALQSVQRRAESAGGSGPDPSRPPESSRMSLHEAYALLNLAQDADSTTIAQARREAVLKFNVDQRQHLEPHIRQIVEAHFAKVNDAFRIIQEERAKHESAR